MILSNTKIIQKIESGELVIAPILDVSRQLSGAKIDLRLDNKFLRIKSEQKTHHDTFPSKQEDEFKLEEIIIPYSKHIVLHPNDFVLGQTFEMVSMPDNLMGELGGRSSLGRQGVIIHATASFVDPGFNGVLCLELSNFGKTPVLLHPLMRIAAISFKKIDGKVTKTYTDQKESKFGGKEIPLRWKQDDHIYNITKNWNF